MLRWFIIGGIMGPLLLLATGFFISNPGALLWVLGIAALPLVIGLAMGINDGLRQRGVQRSNTKRDAEAAVVDLLAPAPVPPRALRLQPVPRRLDFTGWRFSSRAGKGRAPEP